MQISFGGLRLLIFLILASCNAVISERTDDQAWLEFRKVDAADRAPASALKSALEMVPDRGMILECSALKQIEVCYREKLSRYFDSAWRETREETETSRTEGQGEEFQRFYKSHDFHKVIDEMDRFHQALFSGVELATRTRARDLLSSCEKKTPISEHISLEGFSLVQKIPTEMPKAVFGCLVSFWNEELSAILSETAERLGIRFTTEAAQKWIVKKHIAPYFEAELARELRSRAANELARFESEKQGFFAGVDSQGPESELFLFLAPRLRERFPYSPVEQWIEAWRRGSEVVTGP